MHMPFRSIRTKIMLPFVFWWLVLLILMMAATVGVFRYQEALRIRRLKPIPTSFFEYDFAHFLDQIKQVTGAEIVVFNKTDGVNATTLILPSAELARAVRVADARPFIFEQKQPYVSWNVECHGVPYRVAHYPLPMGIVWTYMVDRTESIQSQRRLIWWLAGISMLGLALGSLLGHRISRSVTRPVEQLVAATRRVAQGNLDHRSRIQTQDEIGKLADAFNQMTEQLQTSRQALVEAERFSTAGKMAASFAHEIRNPLSSIQMLIQLLRKRVPSESGKYVKAVQEEVERLNVIVDGLLDFARPSKPVFQQVELAQILDGVMQIMEANLRHHRIECQKEYQSIPAIQADPAKLKQVFMNLILNAMQAMPEGGELSLRLYAQDAYACLNVSDSGVGMSKEQQEHLFEPFFTTKERGTGLGLTNVRRLVEEHSGRIRVKSELNVGTTVTIELPLTREPDSA